MRTKGRKLRNYTLNTRKKKKIKVNDEPLEIPTPSEQEAAYSFIVNEERFPVWIQCIILRYWEDLQHTFGIDWNDAHDKEGNIVEHVIQVSTLPEDKDETGTSLDNCMYTLTVYRTKNKFTIQGNYRQYWTRKEFVDLQNTVNDFVTKLNEDRSIVKAYNKIFYADLNLDIWDTLHDDKVINLYFAATSHDLASGQSRKIEEDDSNNPFTSSQEVLKEETRTADKDKDDAVSTVMLLKDNAINTKDPQQFNNQQNELSKLSGAVKELTAKIELLENKNKELTKQVETLSNKIQQPDPEKMQNEIKTIAETVLNQSIDNKVKDFQLKLTQKLDHVAERKIETINVAKDEINAKLEDHKMIVKSKITSDKKLLDEKIEALKLDLEKAYDEISQLKRANDSKSDKIKNCEEINRELRKKLQSVEESTSKEIQEKMIMFKDDFLNENKIQTAVIDFIEHQAESNDVQQNNRMHILNLDPPTSNQTKRDDKQIKCDIVILMDSNRKYIQRNKLFPNQKVHVLPCPTIEKAKETLANPKFYGQHTIIIHTGVNNVEYNSVEDINEKLNVLLLSCKTTYPQTAIYISSITPRKDDLNEVVIKVNHLVARELEDSKYYGIKLIDHSDLDKPEFLYDAKHLNKNSGIKKLASNIKHMVKSESSILKRRVPTKPKRFSEETFLQKDDPSKKPSNEPSQENKMMMDVLNQLKQMNTFLMNSHYARPPQQQPFPPPPAGPWYRAAPIPPVYFSQPTSSD